MRPTSSIRELQVICKQNRKFILYLPHSTRLWKDLLWSGKLSCLKIMCRFLVREKAKSEKCTLILEKSEFISHSRKEKDFFMLTLHLTIKMSFHKTVRILMPRWKFVWDTKSAWKVWCEAGISVRNENVYLTLRRAHSMFRFCVTSTSWGCHCVWSLSKINHEKPTESSDSAWEPFSI